MKAPLTERGLSPFLPFLLGCAGLFCTLDTIATEMSDHADVADAVVLGEEDLADRAEILRNRYRRMTPGDVPLVQDVGVWPAAWEEFSPVWNDAAAERDLGTWMVPVEAEKDGTDTVLRNGNGVELWRGQTDFSKDGTESVVLTGALVAEDDWALYRAARDEIDRRAATGKWGDGGGMRGTNGLCTNGLHFVLAEGNFATNPPELRVGIVWTNSAMVDVFAYGPLHTSETHVVTYTNDENEVVTWTNTTWHSVEPTLTGFDNAWEWLGTVAVSNVGTNVFVDNSFPADRGIVRYYAAAEAVDSDGDGLNDGMESFVWHTDPLVADSDGDGWGDGMEVALGFDPAVASNVPNVTISGVNYDPSVSDAGKEWVELYSASSRALDLGGFQLEVGINGVWSNKVAFGSDTCIQPWSCLLVGETSVTNADVTATLAIPNAMEGEPNTGVRLTWGGATNGNVADVVFIGRGDVFNSADLDATGWLSTTSVWCFAGKIIERRFPGLDTDQAADWQWAYGRYGQNSSSVIDSDGDGLSDAEEWTGSGNPFGEPTNPWNGDSDGDGLNDYDECVTYETNPNTWATDGDIWPWMPSNPPASDWPGSDSWELEHNFAPTNSDENTNGIPDIWEWMVGLTNLTTGADSDGDGISDWDEMQQNSNPLDSNDADSKPYAVMFSASRPGWVNGTTGVTDNDIGLGGQVQIHFLGNTAAYVVVNVTEGNIAEPFSMTWSGLFGDRCEYSEAGNYGITYAGLAGSAVLTIRDEALHPEFRTLGGEYSIEYAIAVVTFADPEDSGWRDLEERRVVLNDDELRVKIRIYPAQASLQKVFDTFGTQLTLATSATAPEGRNLTLSSSNVAFVQRNGYSELRIVLERAQLSTLGLVPDNGEDEVDEKAWMDFGSSDPAAPSNLLDAYAFESGIIHESRGQSTQYGGLTELPPNSPLDKTYFQSAGRELITATYAQCASAPRQVMNQADMFYLSSHGNHRDGTLAGGMLSPSHLGNYWENDLQCVIVAGCSVLDIGNYRLKSVRKWLFQYKIRSLLGQYPGENWESAGPNYLLGYAYKAPLDNDGGVSIATSFVDNVNHGQDVIEAWKNANDCAKGRNACVIDCSQSPHRFWYWDESSGNPVWTSKTKGNTEWPR